MVQDISRTWGGPRNLAGPLLVVPCTENHITERRVRDESRPPGSPDACRLIKSSGQAWLSLKPAPSINSFTAR